MLFNSLIFIVFAVCFFSLWPLLRRRQNSRYLYIIAASFVFYGWWDWRFLFLITASGLIDFFAALAMDRWPLRKRLFLVLSLVGNLGSLGLFKYTPFLARTLDAGLVWLGGKPWLSASVPDFTLILPVGISFYTFQSMSYTIDAYYGNLKPTRNLLHFFAYLSMFPQLVAGPIVRAAHMLPQLEKAPRPSEASRWEGLRLIAYGYFFKCVIADNLAPAVNKAFELSPSDHGTIFWWVIISMFAFQIYGDFAGYSNIGRGLARWMGYDVPVNFNHPYLAISLREFWTRWHISLSTWFRDYVYIPMGGGRTSPWKRWRNLWATMLLSGLWHGAAWTFVVWAGVHALFLSIERLTGWAKRLAAWPGGKALAGLLVIAQVWVAWVFFRAESFGQALEIIKIMFVPRSSPLDIGNLAFLALALAAGMEACHLLGRRLSLDLQSAFVRWEPVLVSLALVTAVFLRGPGSAFIYFQF